VTEGMDVVAGWYSADGAAPRQDLIGSEGSAYLERDFPKLARCLGLRYKDEERLRSQAMLQRSETMRGSSRNCGSANSDWQEQTRFYQR
jgi:hypothetical protein